MAKAKRGRPATGRPLDQSGIYVIRHKRSGKRYIGSSLNLRIRWWFHRKHLRENKHHCIHLQNAWIKYGEEAFVFEVLELHPAKGLHDREQQLLDTLKPEYNVLQFAGEGTRGLKWTAEQMKNHRMVRDGSSKAQREAARKNVKIAQAASPFGPDYYPSHRVGMKDTPEVVEKRRLARLATINAPDYVNPTKGRKRPKKLMKLIHAKNRGQKRSAESREKMRQSALAAAKRRRAAGLPHWNAKP